MRSFGVVVAACAMSWALTSPVAAQRGAPRPVQVASSVTAACAVMSDGTVWCWGANDAGQLGDGTRASRAAPRPVAGLRGAVEVDLGEAFACARLRDGTVRCWGDGSYGQLGDGERTNRAAPVQVAGIADAVSIGLGYYNACAALRGGGVRCWGSNVFKESAQTEGGREILQPAEVPGIDSAVEVAGGQNHVCARLRDGTVRCWGNNGSRQLGDGTNETRGVPVAVEGVAGATALRVGNTHGCVIVRGGALRCWGSNGYGERGTPGASAGAADVPSLSRVTSAGAGVWASCALSAGEVRCAGDNRGGQLGLGADEAQVRAPRAVEVRGARAVSFGGFYGCALGRRELSCWGRLTPRGGGEHVVMSSGPSVIAFERE